MINLYSELIDWFYRMGNPGKIFHQDQILIESKTSEGLKTKFKNYKENQKTCLSFSSSLGFWNAQENKWDGLWKKSRKNSTI